MRSRLFSVSASCISESQVKSGYLLTSETGPSIQLLHRLTINIDGNKFEKKEKVKFPWVSALHRPVIPGPWLCTRVSRCLCASLLQWPTLASDEYIALHRIVHSLDAKFQRLESGQSMYRTVPSLGEETVEELTLALDFVLRLAQDEDADDGPAHRQVFEQNFCLGPFGLSPAIDYLYRLSILLLTRYNDGTVTHSETLDCFAKFDSLATPLLSLVLTFRSKTSRIQYDPPGFSDFRASLKSSEKYFGVCLFYLLNFIGDANEIYLIQEATIRDRPCILDLELGSDSVEQYRASLEKDFGSSNDHLHMNGRFLLIGPNGMNGILELASHVLDELPESSLEYAEIFSLFQKFCAALAQKVTNWKKVRIIFFLYIFVYFIPIPCRVRALERRKKSQDPDPEHQHLCVLLIYLA